MNESSKEPAAERDQGRPWSCVANPAGRRPYAHPADLRSSAPAHGLGYSSAVRALPSAACSA